MFDAAIRNVKNEIAVTSIRIDHPKSLLHRYLSYKHLEYLKLRLAYLKAERRRNKHANNGTFIAIDTGRVRAYSDAMEYIREQNWRLQVALIKY